jgi:hypothetical protein
MNGLCTVIFIEKIIRLYKQERLFWLNLLIALLMTSAVADFLKSVVKIILIGEI